MYGWFNTKCPKCDYLNPDNAKFCNNCDSDLREHKRRVKEERRRVRTESPSHKKRREAIRKRDSYKDHAYYKRQKDKEKERKRKRARYSKKREQFPSEGEDPYPPPGPSHQEPQPYPYPPQYPYPPPQQHGYPPPHPNQYAYAHPYPPPYPYQYPYPPPYPYLYPPHLYPSLYGDIYKKPAERPRLRFDILPKIFFKPKSAFKEIYPHTSKDQGLAMVFILTMIYVFIQIAFYSAYSIILGSYGTITTSILDDSLYPLIRFVVSIPFALITVYLVGFISARISKEMRGGRADEDKTIGLLGYANVVSLVWGFITMIIIHIIFTMEFSSDYLALPFVYLTMFGILATIGFIWSLIIGGYAVAIANNVSLGRGIITYFFTSLVVVFFIELLMVPLILSSIYYIMSF